MIPEYRKIKLISARHPVWMEEIRQSQYEIWKDVSEECPIYVDNVPLFGEHLLVLGGSHWVRIHRASCWQLPFLSHLDIRRSISGDERDWLIWIGCSVHSWRMDKKTVVTVYIHVTVSVSGSIDTLKNLDLHLGLTIGSSWEDLTLLGGDSGVSVHDKENYWLLDWRSW
jgi:hypothetical protein